MSSLSVYDYCPGGSNQKIKFCHCGCKDILGDLQKVFTALEGDQRASALGRVNILLEKKGNLECLLALKCMLLLDLGDKDDFAETATTFLQASPENSTALAYAAIGAVQEGETGVAFAFWEKAFENAGEEVPDAAFEAALLVGQAMLRDNKFIAGRTLIQVYASFAERMGDERATSIGLQLQSLTQVPLLIRDDYMREEEPPEDAPWAAGYREAFALILRGQWRKACSKFEELHAEFPDEPSLLRNVANLRSWVGQDESAAEAWSEYAHMEKVALDDAVIAEAVATLLGKYKSEGDQLEEVRQVYELTDSERALEQLQASKVTNKIDEDLSELGSEDSPPPKSAFWLLDKPMPYEVENVESSDIPAIVGELYVYGKQTDREARLEFVTLKTSDLDKKLAAAAELLGEFGRAHGDPEATGSVAPGNELSHQRFRFPNGMSTKRRLEVLHEKHKEATLNLWPNLPTAYLDGKTPAEVANDPAWRIRLLALVLIMELAAETSSHELDFNLLREKLGLPLVNDLEIEGDQINVNDVAVCRLHLLPAEKLQDDDLSRAFFKAVAFRTPRAVKRLGLEFIERPSMRERLQRSDIYRLMLDISNDLEDAVEFVVKGRKAAVEEGASAAPWLIRELDLRLIRGESEEMSKIIKRLQMKHAREPGVAQALYQFFTRIGAITPDGQINEQMATQEGADVAGAGSAADSENKIWTPESNAPAADSEKPQIWLPGT